MAPVTLNSCHWWRNVSTVGERCRPLAMLQQERINAAISSVPGAVLIWWRLPDQTATLEVLGGDPIESLVQSLLLPVVSQSTEL